jgi:hypothetical protein
MHQHPPGVGVFITGGKFKFTYPDGKSDPPNTFPPAPDELSESSETL